MLLAPLLALDASSAPATAASPPPLRISNLAEADLIFREGIGWRAAAVRAASRSALSHVGLLTRSTDGRWAVLHAAPPDNGHAGGVKVESLDSFAAESRNARILIYHRSDVDPASRRAVVRAARALIGRRFDDAFDLADPQAIYCTELIIRAYATAGIPIDARAEHLALGGVSGEIVLPESLIESARLRRVR